MRSLADATLLRRGLTVTEQRYDRIELDHRAVALRPVRALEDGFRYYEATTFKYEPWSWCHTYLRRLAIFGFIGDDGSGIVLDVLDERGNIIQDFPLTRGGLKFLRRELRFKVECDALG